ncbi:MAG: hypothetical protein ACYDHN_12045 [Solirubrobacteraceae bacterium]
MYASGIAIGLVTSGGFAGLGLLATKGSLHQAGILLLELSLAWCVGLAFHDHWLVFAFSAVLVVSQHAAWLLYRRRGARLLDATVESRSGADGTIAPTPQVETIAQADGYHRVIEELELHAATVDKVLRRLNTVFKSEEFAELVARQRYGYNSRMYRTYVETHDHRRHSFFEKLRSGKLRHREICTLATLEEILLRPDHPGVQHVPEPVAIAQVQEVIRVLRRYPDGYSLGLSDFYHPFRYGVYDGRVVAIHEAIGHADVFRVNSIFIREPAAVDAFRKEFDLLWEQIPLERRENTAVADTLERMLIAAGGSVED